MVTWHNQPMVAFDTETTGTDPFEARVVSACVARCHAGATPQARSWLIDPGVEIPAEASEIHGITTEIARRDGEPPADSLNDIADALVSAWQTEVPTVVMNAAYDLTVVQCELARHGLPSLEQRMAGMPMLIIDPLVMDRHLDRYRRGKKRLVDLCQEYRVDLDNAHSADGDALATARVTWRLVEHFADQLDDDLHALQQRQADWHREWAVRFEAWLRQEVNPDAVIEREWPLRDATTDTRR